MVRHPPAHRDEAAMDGAQLLVAQLDSDGRATCLNLIVRVMAVINFKSNREKRSKIRELNDEAGSARQRLDLSSSRSQ